MPEYRASAALLRHESGELVGTTYGGTQCWFPREPSKFVSFGDDGRETIIRCRFCRGCRELERRILAHQLVDTFREETKPIWLVVIKGTPLVISLLILRMKRMRKSRGWRGFVRCGMDGFVTIAAGGRPRVPAVFSRLSLSVETVKVRRKQHVSAWSRATSGLLVGRGEYPRWVNRYYIRGLKPRDRAISFTRASRAARGIGKRHNLGQHQHSVRAWKDGVSIHLPEAIRVPRLRRRGGDVEYRVGGGLSKLEALVAGTVRAISVSSPAAQPRPAMSGREPHPHSVDQRKRVLNSLQRYSGSLHSQGYDFDAWAARMAELARKRGGGDDG